MISSNFLKLERLIVCDYQEKEYGYCVDGYLWSVGSGELPCPKCNTDAWLEYWESQWFEGGFNAQFFNMKNKDQVLVKLTKSSLYKNQCAMVKGAKAVLKRKILRGFYGRRK
jgi:hypothetical protein